MTAEWTRRLAGEAFVAAARERLERDGLLEVSGVAGPARLLLSLLLTDRPLLVVVPREKDVEEAAEDLATLAREAGLEGRVLPFPAPGPPPFRGLPRHPDASLRRAAALHAAARGRLMALVASPAGLLRPTLRETRVLSLNAGEEMTPAMLSEALGAGGYHQEDPVTAPGQMARRGGILDVFPPDSDAPVRIEFLADTIESLRRFDPATQRSGERLRALEILPLSDALVTRSTLTRLRARVAERFGGAPACDAFLEALDRGLVPDELGELLPLVPDSVVPPWTHLDGAAALALEPELVEREAEEFLERAREDRTRLGDALCLEPEEALVSAEALGARLRSAPAVWMREVSTEPRAIHVAVRPVRHYAGDLRALVAELTGRTARTVLYLGSIGRAERLAEVLVEGGLALGTGAPTEVRVGTLSRGFEIPEAGLLVLADGDVFPEEVRLHPRGRRGGSRSFLSDFRDLRIGDLVVHQDHGIGRFEGLETLEVGGVRREFMVLSYQGGDKLKVPVEAFDRVQKYASVEGKRPPLDRLGAGRWEKVKRRAKSAMRDMAVELLRLYAERNAVPGHAFAVESPWLREFEESFEYEETPDQAGAIAEVAADMASGAPMDRLICGDVGYGKTEVAMRAAMRAVLDGKQAAVLAPTTVLAFQHWKTFRGRFAPFPVVVEMVSRFRPPREVKAVLAGAASGTVDVLIGTHRLLSRDVSFRDLGLLVVDEEQRFGVAAKEKIKHLKKNVDVLTLSATPIPRTLQMGLAGIRDMSVIETPPKDRLAIQTSIVRFSTDTIAAAIRQELGRDGQVYFVHNRVESIDSLAGLVKRLVPEARVAVAHGQMPELALERTMVALVEGRVDVLVATTIIENGLDIPGVNTILVNRADRFGLAQLYQLRGRVGRSDRRAYAYLLVPPETVLSEVARRRLAAVQEFSELGAGFRIAALDLELRGAGNLLGGEQSGHIEAVGLDLYVKLLEQTILELRGEAPVDTPRAALNLQLDVRIPEEYVPEVHQRMSLYKRLSEVRSEGGIAGLRGEMRDRYGPPSSEAEALLRVARLRLQAEAMGIVQVDLVASALHLRFGAGTALFPEALVAFVSSRPGARISPSGVLKLPVAAGRSPLEALEDSLSALEAAGTASREAAL